MKNNVTRDELIATIKECEILLDEKKGENIISLDLTPIHSYLEFFVIVTAQSRLHSVSLAHALQDKLKEKGFHKNLSPEMNSGWIVLDYFEIVFHIFIEEEREYYNLEKLWQDAEKL